MMPVGGSKFRHSDIPRPSVQHQSSTYHHQQQRGEGLSSVRRESSVDSPTTRITPPSVYETAIVLDKLPLCRGSASPLITDRRAEPRELNPEEEDEFFSGDQLFLLPERVLAMDSLAFCQDLASVDFMHNLVVGEGNSPSSGRHKKLYLNCNQEPRQSSENPISPKSKLSSSWMYSNLTNSTSSNMSSTSASSDESGVTNRSDDTDGIDVKQSTNHNSTSPPSSASVSPRQQLFMARASSDCKTLWLCDSQAASSLSPNSVELTTSDYHENVISSKDSHIDSCVGVESSINPVHSSTGLPQSLEELPEEEFEDSESTEKQPCFLKSKTHSHHTDDKNIDVEADHGDTKTLGIISASSKKESENTTDNASPPSQNEAVKERNSCAIEEVRNEKCDTKNEFADQKISIDGHDDPTCDAPRNKEKNMKLPHMSSKSREEKIRILRERQEVERLKKIEEIQKQADQAERFRLEQQKLRRERLEALRLRDAQRLEAVTARRKHLQEEQKSKVEQILRRVEERTLNNLSNGGGLYSNRSMNSSGSYSRAVFGSSTPRTLHNFVNISGSTSQNSTNSAMTTSMYVTPSSCGGNNGIEPPDSNIQGSRRRGSGFGKLASHNRASSSARLTSLSSTGINNNNNRSSHAIRYTSSTVNLLNLNPSAHHVHSSLSPEFSNEIQPTTRSKSASHRRHRTDITPTLTVTNNSGNSSGSGVMSSSPRQILSGSKSMSKIRPLSAASEQQKGRSSINSNRNKMSTSMVHLGPLAPVNPTRKRVAYGKLDCRPRRLDGEGGVKCSAPPVIVDMTQSMIVQPSSSTTCRTRISTDSDKVSPTKKGMKSPSNTPKKVLSVPSNGSTPTKRAINGLNSPTGSSSTNRITTPMPVVMVRPKSRGGGQGSGSGGRKREGGRPLSIAGGEKLINEALNGMMSKSQQQSSINTSGSSSATTVTIRRRSSFTKTPSATLVSNLRKPAGLKEGKEGSPIPISTSGSGRQQRSSSKDSICSSSSSTTSSTVKSQTSSSSKRNSKGNSPCSTPVKVIYLNASDIAPPSGNTVSSTSEGGGNTDTGAVFNDEMESAKARMAAKRKEMKEKMEKEAQFEKQRQADLKARLEDEQRRVEEEANRLSELAQSVEAERLAKAIQDKCKKEQEEKEKKEAEDNAKKAREERIREESERKQRDLQLKLKMEEDEREARKKRLAEIMARTRPQSSVSDATNEVTANGEAKHGDEENTTEQPRALLSSGGGGGQGGVLNKIAEKYLKKSSILGTTVSSDCVLQPEIAEKSIDQIALPDPEVSIPENVVKSENFSEKIGKNIPSCNNHVKDDHQKFNDDPHLDNTGDDSAISDVSSYGLSSMESNKSSFNPLTLSITPFVKEKNISKEYHCHFASEKDFQGSEKQHENICNNEPNTTLH